MMRIVYTKLLSLLILLVAGVQFAEANPIYVYTQPDGSIRFTDKKPKPGTEYKIFTASKPNFSVYRSTSSYQRNFKLFRSKYNDLIEKAALENRLNPYLLKAVIHAESAFNPQAVSPKGAQGLMQLMPATAKELGVKNAFHPGENISGGARHLARLVVKYNGDLRFALAAYNAGEEPVARYKGIPPFTETQNYVRRVLELKERYKQSKYG